ncbi:MAG: FAD-binding oxidoreductase [Mesorhizobium sp.]|nr:MAG: FAD-binding oxidoreductase [Mesorhizobium sp.]
MINFPYKVSFWATGNVEPANPLGGSDINVDILVIGAGFAGISSAYYLKKAAPDLNIAVVEAEYVGFGPSGRNFGGVTTGMRELRTSFITGFDLEEERFAARYFLRSRDEFEKRIADGAIECEYRNEPILMHALDADAWQTLQHEAELLHQRGTPSKLLNGDEVRKALPIPYEIHGGMVLTAWRSVQPFKLVRGFAEQLRGMGVAIHEATKVSDIHDDGSSVSVTTTDRGTIKASKVVLATNAYTYHMKPFNELLFPRQSYVVATVPLQDDVFQSLGLKEFTYIEDVGMTFYYARAYKNRLLFGGGMPTKGLFSPSTVDKGADTDPVEYERVYEEMQRRFPQLKGVSLEAVWSGPIDITENFAPIIRPMAGMPNVIANFGFNGEGLFAGSLSGKMVIGQVLGSGHSDPDAERVRRYLNGN